MPGRIVCSASAFWFALVATSLCTGAASPRHNVLFIAVDDLRPALGCYGDRLAITPNIDKLAATGTLFRHAYCQQAVCSPSRLSLLTGRRPDTTRVWDLATHFRDALPDVVTLPQHFKRHGYATRSIGKIFHGSGKPAKDAVSWSLDPKYDVVRDPNVRYATAKNRSGKGLKRASTESADVDEETYIDGIVCRESLQAIRDLGSSDQPFFLAVGFRKPHLPFCAPSKYWRPLESRSFSLADSGHPDQAPEIAVRSWKELEGYSDIPSDGKLDPKTASRLRHGYYACVSYVDNLVGRLLEELKSSQLDANTIVVLWGDHGFHLGEQGLWTKANNYELATRVPLIIRIPDQTVVGTRSDALIELIDLYPTLADCCDLPVAAELEGLSFRPLLADPDLPWKRAAFSQFPRAETANRHRKHGDIMGYAVRTRDHRFVQWRRWPNGKIVAEELYDHRIDAAETKNLAGAPGHQKVLAKVRHTLQAGWQAALPKIDAAPNLSDDRNSGITK